MKHTLEFTLFSLITNITVKFKQVITSDICSCSKDISNDLLFINSKRYLSRIDKLIKLKKTGDVA